MTHTVPTPLHTHFLPPCPAWCCIADSSHRVLDFTGARMHSGRVGSTVVRDVEGPVQFDGSTEQYEGIAVGQVDRERAVFLLVIAARDERMELTAEDPAELRQLGELITRGADALDAAHAAAGAVLS